MTNMYNAILHLPFSDNNSVEVELSISHAYNYLFYNSYSHRYPAQCVAFFQLEVESESICYKQTWCKQTTHDVSLYGPVQPPQEMEHKCSLPSGLVIPNVPELTA